MKFLLAYQLLLKSFVYVLLIGQLWVNIASHYYWLIDSESELIELCNFEDSESEEEEKKEEKDDKVRMNLQTSMYYYSSSLENVLHSKAFLSLHPPEISTPPPKFI